MCAALPSLICAASATHESLDKPQYLERLKLSRATRQLTVNVKENSQYITLSCRAFYLPLFISLFLWKEWSGRGSGEVMDPAEGWRYNLRALLGESSWRFLWGMRWGLRRLFNKAPGPSTCLHAARDSWCDVIWHGEGGGGGGGWRNRAGYCSSTWTWVACQASHITALGVGTGLNSETPGDRSKRHSSNQGKLNQSNKQST